MVKERTRSQQIGPIEGISPSRSWTPEILAGALVGLKEAGQPINSKNLQINHSKVRNAIQNLPGGWARIMELAGYDPQEEAKGPFGHGRRMRPKKPW